MPGDNRHEDIWALLRTDTGNKAQDHVYVGDKSQVQFRVKGQPIRIYMFEINKCPIDSVFRQYATDHGLASSRSPPQNRIQRYL